MLFIAAAIFIGTILELLLLEHTEEAAQFVPFVLSMAGFLAVIGVLLAQRRSLLRALRIVMLLVALGGGLGFVLHMKNNIEFEQEIHPGASLGDVLWESLHGASPVLAPGILIIAAGIAAAATWRFDSR